MIQFDVVLVGKFVKSTYFANEKSEEAELSFRPAGRGGRFGPVANSIIRIGVDPSVAEHYTVGEHHILTIAPRETGPRETGECSRCGQPILSAIHLVDCAEKK